MKFADSPRFLFHFAQIYYNRQAYHSIVVAAATRYRQRAVGGVEALELTRVKLHDLKCLEVQGNNPNMRVIVIV